MTNRKATIWENVALGVLALGIVWSIAHSAAPGEGDPPPFVTFPITEDTPRCPDGYTDLEVVGNDIARCNLDPYQGLK